MNAIICLVEGNYWHGLTAIINSAIRNNFSGCIYVGYKNSIPNWLSKFKLSNQSYIISDKIFLKCIEIKTDRHLGYEKPFFIGKIIDSYNPNRILYFDIDCIAVCDFNFFLTWCENHIALCVDECYDHLSINHPWKIFWKKKILDYNLPIVCLDHLYINSGFIGVSKTNFDIIDTWKLLINNLENDGLETRKFIKSPLNAVQGDQEVLNMALMTKSKEQLSIIGKEGMGFQEPCYLMVHCTKPQKPWNKLFLFDFIKNGYPISIREKKYFNYLISPYNNLGKSKTFIKKIDIFITKIASRIF